MLNIPPPLDYATPKKGKRVSWIGWVLILFGFALALEALDSTLNFLLPTRAFNPHVAQINVCRSNLMKISEAISIYSRQSGGLYPDSLSTLFLNEPFIAPQFYICPSSKDTLTTAPTTQQQASDMAKPGHLSYIYLGKGLTDKTVLPNQVIAYEPLSNHEDGMDVLLGNGQSQFVKIAGAKKILSDVTFGTNPVLLHP